MAVLSLEEFNNKVTSEVNSLEKIYQGKTVVAGPVFALTNIQAATLYCNNFIREKDSRICLIVEEKGFLRIWSETDINNQKQEVDYLTKKDEFVIICQKTLAQYLGPIASVICKKTLSKNQNLTPEKFVDLLAKKISDPQQAQAFKDNLLK